MGQPEHSTILNRAAKSALTPLGFKQKGRSRVWLADRGYWLSVIEFQPSGFSRGSYLNTSAHWLWQPSDALSFDYRLPDCKRPFISFHDQQQFEPLASGLAALAVSEATRLDERLSSLENVAQLLVERHEQIAGMPQHHGPEWDALHAAMATGALGRSQAASALLDAFLNGPCAQFVGAWGQDAKQALADGTFLQFIANTIDEARLRFRLSKWRGAFLADVA